jgi:sugar porter (SP) family MFS transporter
MLGVEAFPAALFFVLLFFIPPSPRWLVKQGRAEEARRVLERLGEEDVEREMQEIIASLPSAAATKSEPLFQRRLMRPILLAWAVAMFNQLSGINALMYYAPRIFQMAGAAASDALLQAVAVGGTNLAFTILAMFVIDRFGRRPLLVIGSVGTAASLAVVAAAFFGGGEMGPAVLVGLLAFIAFFALSQGAVIWVFISEIFPNRVRSKGQSLGSFTHWFMAALVSWTFPVIAARSPGHAFAFFSFMMVLQFFFAWKILPETKGLSLEELEYKLGVGTDQLRQLEEKLHVEPPKPA